MFTCILVTRCSDFNDNKGNTKRRWSACVLACIAGAGFVVAQEEISRERAGRRGGFLTHSRDHLAWPKKI